MGLIIEAAAYSHIGGRKNNEDNFYLNGVSMEREQMNRGGQCHTDFADPTQIYAVCDGMGGAMFGEEASLLAVKSLRKYQQNCEQPDSSVHLEQLLRQISDGINQISFARNMPAGASGSTIAMLIMKDWYFRCVHVGDSRIYRLREGMFEQLTRDHSQVQQMVDAGEITPEEAFRHPLKNVITQHLGMPEETVLMTPEISQRMELRAGDKFLICSDGLSDVVPDSVIAQLLSANEATSSSAASMVRTALNSADEFGVSSDNVTIIRLDVRETEEKGSDVKRMRRLGIVHKLLGASVALLAAGLCWVGYDLIKFLIR